MRLLHWTDSANPSSPLLWDTRSCGTFAPCRVEPFPEYGFGRYDPACGSHYRLAPGGSLGMILIASAGYGDPEGVSPK